MQCSAVQCRKTYAYQLGHADTSTLEKHYGKWIPKQGDIKPTELIEQRLDKDHRLELKRPMAPPALPWYRRLMQRIAALFGQ